MSLKTIPWVQDAIFYQIFPDRFAKSRRADLPSNLEDWNSPPTLYGFKGGDFAGMTEKLDYLSELGINAIYFTPVFASTANHRYHTFDYFNIDPILGGNEAFKLFLDAAHARGIKVVLDGVFNHASRGFYQFNHTLENGLYSPYLDWFTFDVESLRQGKTINAYQPDRIINRAPEKEAGLTSLGYRAWWDLPALPKLNFNNKQVREFVLKVATYWLEMGIDGWRLDVPHEIEDQDFWREFRTRVKAVKPDAYICGEIWDNASAWLQGDQFDAVMNYIYTKAVIGFCVNDQIDQHELKRCGGYHDVVGITGQTFAERMKWFFDLYPSAIYPMQMNLIGSHDTPRILTLAQQNTALVHLCFTMLFTFAGAPCIYYGDEIGLQGGQDPDCRRGFPWDESNWNRETLSYVRKLIELRRTTSCLRDGIYATNYAADHIIAYSRTNSQECCVVVINRGKDAVGLTMVDILPPQSVFKNWRDYFSRKSYAGSDQKSLTVEGESVLILLGSK